MDDFKVQGVDYAVPHVRYYAFQSLRVPASTGLSPVRKKEKVSVPLPLHRECCPLRFDACPHVASGMPGVKL
jgi:hypothetical protein